MEPPTKRARFGYAPYDDDDDDELNLDPEELAAKQDPGYQLQRSREVAAHRLKSTFESIFEKYGKDFTDVGDEIDLRTGEIVVDNGHLRSMQGGNEEGNGPADGQGSITAGGTDVFREEDSSDEEDRILHGPRQANELPAQPGALITAPPAQSRSGQLTQAWPRTSKLAAGSQRMPDMAISSRLSFMGKPLSFGSFGPPALSADPMWSAPELPLQTFTSGFRPFSGMGMVKAPTTRTIVRRALPMAVENTEDDDDVLLGVADKITKERKAPQAGSSDASHASEDISEAAEEADVEMQEPKTTQNVAAKSLPKPIGKSASKPSRKSLSTLEQGPNKLPLVKQSSKPKPKPKASKPTKANRQVVVVQTPSVSEEQTQVSGGGNDEPDDAENSTARKQLVIANPRKRRRVEARNKSVAQPASLHAQDVATLVDPTSFETISSAITTVSRPFPAERLVIEIEHRQELPKTPVVKGAEENSINKDGVGLHEAESGTAGQKHKSTQETFERNVVDPSYGFSDEEGGLIIQKPARKTEQQPVHTHNSAGGGQMNVNELDTGMCTTKENTAARKTSPAKKKSLPSKASPVLSSDEVRIKTQATEKQTKRQRHIPKDQENVNEAVADTNVIEEEENSPFRERTRSPQKPPVGASSAKIDAATPNGHSRSNRHPNSNPPSSSKTGIVSLISDSDEDELSFEAPGSAKQPALPHRPKSTPATRRVLFSHNSGGPTSASVRKTSLRRGLLLSAQKSGQKRAKPAFTASHSSPLVSRPAITSGARRGSDGAAGSLSVPPKGQRASLGVRRSSSPTESLIRTPGGSMRRCGEDGFKCERDFCFICL